MDNCGAYLFTWQPVDCGNGERYVHVTHLTDGVSVSQLPADVCKYVINTGGGDARAYDDTDASEWIDTEEGRMSLNPDGTYVTGGWLVVDDYTPDGYYVDDSGAWDGRPTNIEADV